MASIALVRRKVSWRSWSHLHAPAKKVVSAYLAAEQVETG
jgi:hypothetical protein